MKHFFLPLLLIFSPIILLAQIPDGYYQNAANKKGYALRTALFSIIDNHNVISYGDLWEAFYTTDRKPDGTVWDIYSDIPNGTPPYQFTFYNDQCGNYSSEGDCYNREHSIPKSWFGDQSPMYSDLFHLYPTDGWVNNKRGNLPFSEVNATWTSNNGSKVGNSTASGFTGAAFEPIDAYKGDLARSYFYMTVRYLDKNLGQETLSMFNGSNLKPWALQLLLQWHLNDPVSQKEIDRNNAIFQLQHNRNPFIDYPELVNLIFTADSITPFNPNSINSYQYFSHYSLFPNPATDFFYLNNLTNNNDIIYSLLIFNSLGEIILHFDTPQNANCSFNISSLTKGFYFVKIMGVNCAEIHPLIIQ